MMKHPQNGIALPPLIPGVLIRRYKRFLADIRLDTGKIITAHCPNSGRMTTCCEAGRRVYVSHQNRPERKLKYTWELIDMPTSLVGINTLVPNRMVYQCLTYGLINGFGGYNTVKREVKAGQHSRLDIMLTDSLNNPCYMEIKNCTLVENGIAYFPDAVTARGQNHLILLQQLIAQGNRCVMFFLIQRMDATLFKPADHIDPTYGKELRKARESGVEVVVYDVNIDLARMALGNPVPYEL